MVTKREKMAAISYGVYALLLVVSVSVGLVTTPVSLQMLTFAMWTELLYTLLSVGFGVFLGLYVFKHKNINRASRWLLTRWLFVNALVSVGFYELPSAPERFVSLLAADFTFTGMDFAWDLLAFLVRYGLISFVYITLAKEDRAAAVTRLAVLLIGCGLSQILFLYLGRGIYYPSLIEHPDFWRGILQWAVMLASFAGLMVLRRFYIPWIRLLACGVLVILATWWVAAYAVPAVSLVVRYPTGSYGAFFDVIPAYYLFDGDLLQAIGSVMLIAGLILTHKTINEPSDFSFSEEENQ